MMDTQKEGGQAGDSASALGYTWVGFRRELDASRTVGACLFHLPCPKCFKPTPNFTHPMAKGSLCPVLTHSMVSEYQPQHQHLWGVPEVSSTWACALSCPSTHHCSPTCWEPGAEPRWPGTAMSPSASPAQDSPPKLTPPSNSAFNKSKNCQTHKINV